MIAKLRKIFDEKRQDYGPQNFKEVEIALSYVIGILREAADGNTNTKEHSCVKSAYHKRGDSTYFDKMHANLQGRYRKAWNAVKEHRSESNERYEVTWDPVDGRPELEVQCLNGFCDKFKEVNEREQRLAKRAKPKTTTAAADASIYVKHGLQSTRVSPCIPTPEVAKPDSFRDWVFLDDECDDEVVFGQIQYIGEQDGLDCVFYKRVRQRVAINEEYIELNEFMGYFETGEQKWVGHGKHGVALAKQQYNELQQ